MEGQREVENRGGGGGGKGNGESGETIHAMCIYTLYITYACIYVQQNYFSLGP